MTDIDASKQLYSDPYYMGLVTVESVVNGGVYVNTVIIGENGERFTWRHNKHEKTKIAQALSKPGDTCYVKYRVSNYSRYGIREIAYMRIRDPQGP